MFASYWWISFCHVDQVKCFVGNVFLRVSIRKNLFDKTCKNKNKKIHSRKQFLFLFDCLTKSPRKLLVSHSCIVLEGNFIILYCTTPSHQNIAHIFSVHAFKRIPSSVEFQLFLFYISSDDKWLIYNYQFLIKVLL